MIELRAGTARVTFDDRHGGRVERLTVDGFDLLVPPELDDHNYGMFPMAPWAGRIRHGRFRFEDVDYTVPCNHPPHAIHGIARDRRWRVDQESATAAVASVVLDAPWPFGGRVVQRLELQPDAFAVTMEIHAAGRPMPATGGWHPWWNRLPTATGGALEVELHADRMYARDDEGIPTGELVPVHAPPWDDCFTDLGTPAAVLTWPGAYEATLVTDCSCLVVFTEPEHAICVEPQSGPPDAFNLGQPVVTPDAPLVIDMAVRWVRGRSPETP